MLQCFSRVFFCSVAGTDVGVLTLVEGSFAPFGELILRHRKLYGDMSHDTIAFRMCSLRIRYSLVGDIEQNHNLQP